MHLAGMRAQTKLVDAGFIWTEPHSKRLKLKLTIQARAVAPFSHRLMYRSVPRLS